MNTIEQHTQACQCYEPESFFYVTASADQVKTVRPNKPNMSWAHRLADLVASIEQEGSVRYKRCVTPGVCENGSHYLRISSRLKTCQSGMFNQIMAYADDNDLTITEELNY